MIVTVDSYKVEPASNGWIIRWDAKQVGGYSAGTTAYTVICRTSTEVATFFRSLDKGRKEAVKQSKENKKKESLGQEK